MENNQFFNLRRFGMLCRMEWIGAWKMHLRRFVACYAGLAFVLVGYGLGDSNPSLPAYEHNLRFLVHAGLFVMGAFFASCFMECMKTKEGRIAYLMLPASAFEKYLSRWLLFTVGFVLMYILAFELADWTRVVVSKMYYSDLAEQIKPLDLSCYIYGADGNVSIWSLQRTGILITMCCFVQSLFVLGSSIWPKKTIGKTLIAIVMICLANIQLGHFICKEWGGFHNPILNDNDAMTYLVMTIGAVFAVFNWTLAYFRFKESEIINRW